MSYLNTGWVKLMRNVQNTKSWDDPYATAVYSHCLMRANIKPQIVKGIMLQAGQFITSVHTFAEECHLSDKQMRIALDKLKADRLITCQQLRNNNGRVNGLIPGQTTGRIIGTIITVENYGFEDNQSNSEGKQTGEQYGEQQGNSIRKENDKSLLIVSPTGLTDKQREEILSTLNEMGIVPDNGFWNTVKKYGYDSSINALNYAALKGDKSLKYITTNIANGMPWERENSN